MAAKKTKKSAKKVTKKIVKKVAKKTVKKAAPKKKVAKKTVKKKLVKKVAKKAVKKAAKKTAAKKKVAKKIVKKSAPKKKVAKKIVKKAVKKTAKKVKKATKVTKKSAAKATKKTVKKAVKKAKAPAKPKKPSSKDTPSVFKIRARKQTPIVFTLDDVKEIVKKRADQGDTMPATALGKKAKKAIKAKKAAKKSVHKAASVADILGFNPGKQAKTKGVSLKAADVPKKWVRYYKALMELRDHAAGTYKTHAEQTLHHSNKEDSGDLSSYGQHMADAGTDSFERDFALSLLANEQEAIMEIDAALKRIEDGSYGVCEVTGQAIAKERLMAVPFTRYSLQGQQQAERNYRKRNNLSGGTLTDFGDDMGGIQDDPDA